MLKYPTIMVDVNTLLKHKELFSLPKGRPAGHFPSFIDFLFDQYLKAIGEFDGIIKEELTDKKPIIEEQCSLIKECLDLYYRGFTYKSFHVLQSLLSTLTPSLPIQKVSTGYANESLNLYRIRTGTNYPYSKEELFHVPFSDREKVSSARYSIPGLPCLYLGNSIYVCWEEMGRPDLNSIHVSRFELQENAFKFLRFGGLTLIIRGLYSLAPQTKDEAKEAEYVDDLQHFTSLITQYLLT